MPIIAKANGSSEKFTPCPAGAFSAVCCDVVDLGMLKVTYSGKEKTQHKVRICWQVDETNADDKRFVVSKRYTLSLHEKSALRKDLESWRGRAFTELELEGFDVESVLSVPCMLSVIHNRKGEDVYANVSAITRLPRGLAALQIQDYVRMQDREQQKSANPEPQWDDRITDEDIPF